ncbi:MAG: NUDIX hydrolase [Jiangellaceae bacterium]
MSSRRAVADRTVVAAGAVVWRPRVGLDRDIEICLVHRPRYDDWSLPKGKVNRDEHLLACAVREVQEETGHRVVLGRPLPGQLYQVDGLPKQVHYWAARADDDVPEWQATGEVDEVVFLPAAEALRRLTHPRDAGPVAALVAGPVRTTPLVVLRHTDAVPRSSWTAASDAERPLDERGVRDAIALIAPLSALGIARVVTSDAVRCVETVRPLAEAVGTDLELDPVLSEDGHLHRPDGAGRLTRALLADAASTVICAHRPVLPDVIAAATEKSHVEVPDRRLRPGEFLVLHHHSGAVAAAELHHP